MIVLNDQGGSVMETSDIAATLRAQDHGHPPVVCGLTNRGYESGKVAETLRAESHLALPLVAYCFEPGILKREGGNSRIMKNQCSTLRAEMGDNQPATCYAVYPGVSITSKNSGSNPRLGDPCPTLTNDTRFYLVGVEENAELSESMGSGREENLCDRRGDADALRG